ncbi:MAG: hypothetical protein AB8B80_09290 [Marinicellaceae bacterium]
MKTHINQLFTIVSFFSLSLTTTLVISWGINGLLSEKEMTITQCMTPTTTVINASEVNTCPMINDTALKVIVPKSNINPIINISG